MRRTWSRRVRARPWWMAAAPLCLVLLGAGCSSGDEPCAEAGAGREVPGTSLAPPSDPTEREAGHQGVAELFGCVGPDSEGFW